MKLRTLAIAIAALSSAGAIANTNTTSADSQQTSNQSYATSQNPGSSSMGDSSQISQAQQALNDMGLNAGPVDGRLGPKTQSALKQFQQQKGLQASGKLDQQTVALLGNGSSANASSTTSASQQGQFSPQGQDASGGTSVGTNGSSSPSGMTGNNGSAASSPNNGSTTAPQGSTTGNQQQPASSRSPNG